MRVVVITICEESSNSAMGWKLLADMTPEDWALLDRLDDNVAWSLTHTPFSDSAPIYSTWNRGCHPPEINRWKENTIYKQYIVFL